MQDKYDSKPELLLIDLNLDNYVQCLHDLIFLSYMPTITCISRSYAVKTENALQPPLSKYIGYTFY